METQLDGVVSMGSVEADRDQGHVVFSIQHGVFRHVVVELIARNLIVHESGERSVSPFVDQVLDAEVRADANAHLTQNREADVAVFISQGGIYLVTVDVTLGKITCAQRLCLQAECSAAQQGSNSQFIQ